jgi:hypothetical protein
MTFPGPQGTLSWYGFDTRVRIWQLRKQNFTNGTWGTRERDENCINNYGKKTSREETTERLICRLKGNDIM